MKRKLEKMDEVFSTRLPGSIHRVIQLTKGQWQATEVFELLKPLGGAVFIGFCPASQGPKWSYVLVSPCEENETLEQHGCSTAGLQTDCTNRNKSPWEHLPLWVGEIAYETGRQWLERPDHTSPEGRPTPHHDRTVWRRFRGGAAVHQTGRCFLFAADDEALTELYQAMQHPLPPRTRCQLRQIDGPKRSHHTGMIQTALDYIAAGDIYEVNVASQYTFEVKGEGFELFKKMMKKTNASYCYYSNFGTKTVMTASPEEFLYLNQQRILRTRPIKGTRPRGRCRRSDRATGNELDASEKERAELAMVVDVERNDLAKICDVGTVRVVGEPTVSSYPTLHHRIAEVKGRLRTGFGLHEVLRATFPSGSITGAPKGRAMEVIAQLEPSRRGLYTGAVGYVNYAGELQLAMAIRTLTVVSTEAHYHAGGGIVADSDPDAEFEEIQLKAAHISQLLELRD